MNLRITCSFVSGEYRVKNLERKIAKQEMQIKELPTKDLQNTRITKIKTRSVALASCWLDFYG